MEKTTELLIQLVKDYEEVDRLKKLPKEDINKVLQQKTEELYKKVLNANSYEYFKIVDELFIWQYYFGIDYILTGKEQKGNLSYEESKDKIYNSLPFLMKEVDPKMTFLAMPMSDWCDIYKNKIYALLDINKERKKLHDYSLLSNGVNSKKDENKLYYVDNIPVWFVNYICKKYGCTDKTVQHIKEEWNKRLISHLVIPEGFDFVNLSYFVSKYYNIDFTYQEGDNAPKLAKQLSKQKVDYTNDEIIAFTELDTLLKSIKKYKGSQHILLNTTDFTIPKAFTAQSWAFQSSCHVYDSSSGCDSPQFLNALGFEMTKMYHIGEDDNGNYTLYPCSRIYFYKDENGDIGMAGAYSDCNNGEINHTAYQASRIILSVLFNKRLSDFKKVPGLPQFKKVEDIYRHDTNTWLNVSGSNDYVTYGTTYGIFAFDKKYLEEIYSNLTPMRIYQSKYIKNNFVEKPIKLRIKGE